MMLYLGIGYDELRKVPSSMLAIARIRRKEEAEWNRVQAAAREKAMKDMR